MIALIAIGLNVCGQAACSTWLRRLLRHRRVHGRDPHEPRQPVEPDRRVAVEDWAWLAALPIAVAITSLSGLILGSPTLRLRGDYLAIVTLGFGEIVRLLATTSTS
nr:hypothetical protein [Cellulosimicrobium sp. MM]